MTAGTRTDKGGGAASTPSEPSARDVLQGHAALVVVQLCFGLFPVFALWSTGPDGWSPSALAAFRILFGAVVLSAIAFARHRGEALPRRSDLLLLAACSFLGVTLNQVLYLRGVSTSTASHAGVTMGLIPLFTFAIAAASGQERLRATRALGVLTALAGVLLWRFLEEEADVLRYGHGNLLMAANALSYSCYLVLSKPLLRRLPPLVVIAWVYLLALPFVPVLAWGADLSPDGVSGRALASLGYTLVFPTVIAYLLNTFALSRLRASTTAVYIYLQVIISALGGVVMRGEHLSPALLLTAVLVFVGIALVVRRPPPVTVLRDHGTS